MSEQKTIGVVLSGSGVFDGSEIHEAVICLLALDRAGVNIKCYAPDINLDEINHATGEPTGAQRSVLIESARISRGNIHDLAQAKGTDVNGWIFPGGFGAAKNLSNVAVAGGEAEPNAEVARVINEALDSQTPIGACCIAPAMLASAVKGTGRSLRLTIGNDAGTAGAIEAMGSQHVECAVDATVEDGDHRVVTAPAYMYDESISQIAKGIESMVNTVVSWA